MENVMTLPNFFLIGAGKAGTTALYEYLTQHPQIYMSKVKEPNFFAFMDEKVNFSGPGEDRAINKTSIANWDDYLALFKNVTQEKAIGEASHWYLYSEKVADRIKKYIPQAKLIAILRDPVKRAYSDYMHFVRENRETCDNFLDAIQEENNRINNNWGFGHYIKRGLYYDQVKRYLDTFDPSQIKIYLNEDLQADPQMLLSDIFEFLEIDNTFKPDTSYRPNVSGIPKNKILHSLLGQSSLIRKVVEPIASPELRKLAIKLKGSNLARPPLNLEIRHKIIQDFFVEDILKLQDLIGRDLSTWLT